MITMQQSDNNVLSPKPQQHSRAPSPVPSAVYTSTTESMNGSLPRLPLPHKQRRSSFSTEVSVDNMYEDKSLITQKSYPHLISSKKKNKKSSSNKRRGSDATTTTDDNMGSDGSFSTATITTDVLTKPFANDKRNHDFHILFRSVPDGERLIDDYGCALQKEILLQGRVYISEHHLCFNANIFGWITNLVIAFADIEDIEKRTTAIFIPNAILISTGSSKHFLASFLSRDQAYDQMVEIWKASHANSSIIEVHHHDKFNDDATAFSEDDESDDFTSSSDYSYTEDEEEADEVNTALLNPNSIIQDKSIIQDRQASLASLPLPKHLSADEAARRRAVSEAGPRPNIQEYIKKSESTTTTNSAAAAVLPTETTSATETTEVQQKEQTDCECSKNAQHFPTVVMNNKYNTTIETMYNLLYNSSFMGKFLSEVEKSTEVCIGQWSKGNDVPYSRESSYIKFLGGSIGPKSTKCYLKEDVLHLDPTDYVCQLTVTQTPDVPSGGSFSVKTKTCISWCGQNQVRVLVTVLVDFTKSSWLKSTIEKASVDGQQNFYKSLDAAVRKYLDQHAGETKAVSGKKKGGKRRHHKHRREQEAIRPSFSPEFSEPPVPKQHFILEIFSSLLNWLIEHASVPNTAHLTAICVAILAISNIYIASKMAGVNNQLNQLAASHHHSAQHEHKTYDDMENNSLWKLLSKLDPDARKEDLNFVQHTRQPLPSSITYTNPNNNVDNTFDENLEFSQMAKNKLDRQMMELEKMIQKAGQSMEQVTEVVQNQRKRILNPEWK